MNIVFFDPPTRREALKPFTLTRPIASIRTGILTLEEKWTQRLASIAQVDQVAYLTEAYLLPKYPWKPGNDVLLINASVFPSESLVRRAVELAPQQAIIYEDEMLAARLPADDTAAWTSDYLQQTSYTTVAQAILQLLASYTEVAWEEETSALRHVWDIFLHNQEQILQDFALLTQQRHSQELTDPYTRVYQPDQIFIEEGATIRAAVINAEAGPVYIGKGATVHENAVIKGPFAMLEGSHVNIGSKIREATTIGPHCKVGGEVKNTVFFGNSNKGHEGFIGNSVVGEWCNIGADSNTSNLKNNYQPVQLWNYGSHTYEDTGLLFCGLMMGDHSKCSINTMFNTGTVIGVFANIFGTGFPAKLVPSFTWGGIADYTTYHLNKAIEVYERVLQRKNQSLPSEEVAILKHIFDHRTTEFPS